ncbi:MAG: hypothetical protein FWB85_04610 [Chitinispirillia bacterium]|nr:hypothetical protein [Chitinispirillia bacterium]MCL2241860.1 hypothetical protein [Chitinispirillia bacterium]
MKRVPVGITAMMAVLAVLSSLALLSGCGGGATKVIVAPGYKRQFAINAELALVVLDKSPNIIYTGDLRKSLGALASDTGVSAERHAIDFFRAQLMKDIAGEIDVKEVFDSAVVQDYLVTKDFFRTADEDITLEIPDKGTKFAFGEREAALVLFLDKIRIGTETDPYYQERAQHGLYLSNARKLVYLASFVLWDNRELRPICYGRVKADTPISREEAAAGDWEEVSRNFVRAMFEPTGFRKREDKTTGVEFIH